MEVPSELLTFKADILHDCCEDNCLIVFEEDHSKQMIINNSQPSEQEFSEQIYFEANLARIAQRKLQNPFPTPIRSVNSLSEEMTHFFKFERCQLEESTLYNSNDTEFYDKKEIHLLESTGNT